LRKDRQQPVQRHDRGAFQQIRQRLTVNQLHYQVAAPIFFAVVIQLRDVRMGQSGRVAGLGAQPDKKRFITGVLGAQHLNGNVAVEELVVGSPYFTHPANRDLVA